MGNLLNGLHRVLSWLLALSVALLMVPVLLQIFSRYVGFIPRYVWTEEMARFCFIWMIMIGAMIGVRESTHFDVDVLPEVAPQSNRWLRVITHAAMLIFALVFLVYGYRFAAFGLNQTSELASLPMWLIFIAWPLTGATSIFFLGEKLLADIRRIRTGASV